MHWLLDDVPPKSSPFISFIENVLSLLVSFSETMNKSGRLPHILLIYQHPTSLTYSDYKD